MGKVSIGIILVLGLGLRLINLNQSLWLDEAAQALMSSQSLGSIWADRTGDFHPPLFYFLAHYWLFLSHAEIWLRLLPVSFGVINILVVYALGQKLLGRGLLAAFLMAIAPFHIYYSQEFRAYSLLALLGTLSMYYLITGRFRWLAITNALLLYTHYSSVFLILTQFLIQPKTIRYSLLALLLYVPWMPKFISQLQSGTSALTYLPGWDQVLSIQPLRALPVVIFKLVAGRISFLNRYLYGLYILFVFLVTFWAMRLAGAHKRLLLIWAFAPFFIMFVVSFFLPQTQPFRIIYVLPALVLLFTQAVSRFPKTFLTLIVYIAVVGNLAYFTRPRLQRESWREAGEFLRSQAAPVVVKFPAAFAPLMWYTPDLTVVPALPALPTLDFPKIFLLEYLTGLTDPSRQIDRQLTAQGFHENRVYNFEGVGLIYEYTKIYEGRD